MLFPCEEHGAMVTLKVFQFEMNGFEMALQGLSSRKLHLALVTVVVLHLHVHGVRVLLQVLQQTRFNYKQLYVQCLPKIKLSYS